MVLLLDYLIVANHFGVAKISSTIYLPVALTYFLIVTTYATHQHRLFDIEFFIPWSRVRKRKTAFYQRLQATVAELAALRSVDDAVARVADILRCPVALVGGRRPVLAHAGAGSIEIAQFPHEPLEQLNRIVVANEIESAMPDIHGVMRQFRVAAIVPFHPHSKTAASFLLLGDSFSDTVYTPLDFKKVERLFDSLGEFFLDKIAFLRAELAEARQESRSMKSGVDEAKKEAARLREEVALLRESNFRLMRENRAVRNALESRPSPSSKAAPVLKLAPKPDADWSKTLGEHLEHAEATMIAQALKTCNGNKSEAARLLGIRPNTLHYKLERFGLAVTKTTASDQDDLP
jgi:hypothetical protein